MVDGYRQQNNDMEIVRDFIAGMTDDYFLRQAKSLGCEIPLKKCSNFPLKK
jgi:dGTPase